MAAINVVKLLAEGPDYVGELVKYHKDRGYSTNAYDWIAYHFGTAFANLHFHNWPLKTIQRSGYQTTTSYDTSDWIRANNIDKIGNWGNSTQGHEFWEHLNRLYKGDMLEEHIEAVRSFVCTYPQK